MPDVHGATGTWHHGLVARWWSEFNRPEPAEVAYLAAAIRRYGQPALDLGCGNGRLLLPLLEAGFDVDGVDVSKDMIDLARATTERDGYRPLLAAQAKHDLELGRRYRTIFMIGVLDIGGNRARDREGLHRAFDHLEPGGTLLINHELPYADVDAGRWAEWLPTRPIAFPQPWPASGDRRRLADGDEIELIGRGVAFDPLAQRQTREIRARLWHDGVVVLEETSRIELSLYFAQEVVGMLASAGFEGVEIQSGYSGRPAVPDDPIVTFVGHRPMPR